MARPRASVEQRKAQRDRIQRAAAEIYREQGLGAVTVRAVSERAGVSAGTLYRYFENLEALMQSLWIEPVAEVNRRMEKEVADLDRPLDRIRALLDGYVRFARDQPDVFKGAVLFVRPSTAPTPEVESLEELPFYRLLVGSIEEGQATGEIIDGDARTMAQLLWAGVHGALGLPVNIDRFQVLPASELAPAMIDQLITGITVGR